MAFQPEKYNLLNLAVDDVAPISIYAKHYRVEDSSRPSFPLT